MILKEQKVYSIDFSNMTMGEFICILGQEARIRQTDPEIYDSPEKDLELLSIVLDGYSEFVDKSEYSAKIVSRRGSLLLKEKADYAQTVFSNDPNGIHIYIKQGILGGDGYVRYYEVDSPYLDIYIDFDTLEWYGFIPELED